MDEKKQLLIIGYVWPEPDSSAAGRRMMNLISLFQSGGWEITFATSAAESEHRADLESLSIDVENIEVNSSEFDDLIDDLQPTAVLFDRFVTEEQFGWRVAEQCPGAVRILDTEDLHCLRRARKKAVKEDRQFTKEDLLREDTTKREIASIYRSDLSLMISEFEMKLLSNFFDIDEQLLVYLPFRIPNFGSRMLEQWPPFEERNHFMTIGNFRHEPNWDSVCYLNEQVWPLIRTRLPDAQLHIYGSYVTQKARQLHNPGKGFYIKGRAEDAKEVMRQARICLAPLRFGAGLKGKLIEAMQCGTPSITTPVGAEGLKGKLKWSGAIAVTPDQLASKAVALYTDKAMWRTAQQQGIEILKKRFDNPDMEKDFLKRVGDTRSNLKEHRRNNFVGQMLMHHTAASTKYMSRWIEEKNRG